MAYSFQTFTFNQVLTAAQMNQVEANVRDHAHGGDGVAAVNSGWFAAGAVNTTDIASGAVHADQIASGQVVPTTHLASGGVIQGAIVTATAEAAGTVSFGGRVDIALNAYAFFPMIHTSRQSDVWLSGHDTDGADPDQPRLSIHNGSPDTDATYDVDHRYVSA